MAGPSSSVLLGLHIVAIILGGVVSALSFLGNAKGVGLVGIAIVVVNSVGAAYAAGYQPPGSETD